MPAGAATAGDADGVTRDGLVERGQRHRRRRRDRRKAEANRKRRRKKHFHGYFPFLTNMPRRGGGAWTQNIVAAWQQEAPVTSDGGANGASDADASGGASDASGDASDGANGVPSGLPRA